MKKRSFDIFIVQLLAATDLDEVSEPIQLTKVLIRPPMHCQFMSATSSDGQRVYMRMREEKSLKKVDRIGFSRFVSIVVFFVLGEGCIPLKILK